MRWWRVIPAKLIGGMGTLGASMVLGREGPTVQMGASAGQFVHDTFKLNNPESRHILLATGAAAGLAAAFNAPLAGILLIIEEMREDARAQQDQVLLPRIKKHWLASGGCYGYRNIHLDLQDEKVVCGRDRVLRLMRQANLRAIRSPSRPKGRYGGRPDVTAPNVLDRQFKVSSPNTWWVTDITYIQTQEGFLFLAVVIDLFSRRVIGWSMGCRMTEQLVQDALLAAYQQRKPEQPLYLHSDQGSQYTSQGFRALLTELNIEPSMSRRGNCWDNAVAESFFSNLKKERKPHNKYKTREKAKQALFHYIEMFYNPTRRHTANQRLSPADYERRYFMTLKSV